MPWVCPGPVQFARAFKDMTALEGGAIANPDEKRMVGHYWLRKPEIAPNPTVEKEIRECTAAVVSFAKGIVDGSVSATAGHTCPPHPSASSRRGPTPSHPPVPQQESPPQHGQAHPG